MILKEPWSSNIKIEEITQRTFIVIGAYAGIVTVKEQLLKDSFCVVLDKGSFLGILTAADIVESPYQLVIDCLHRKPHVDYDQEIIAVLSLMNKNHTPVFPVFRKKEFIGIISREFITNYLIENPADREQKIAGPERNSKAKGELKEELKEELKSFIDAPLKEPEGKKSGVGISILLASRDSIYRTAVRNMLEKRPDIEVKGEADSGQAAVGLVKDCNPDIIIIDCKMADPKYSDFIKSISSAYPAIRIIVRAGYPDKRCIKEMIKGGADSCLLEDSSFDELIHAIHMVKKGIKYFSTPVKKIIETGFAASSNANGSSIFMLTNREREVLKLISEGNSTKEIAYSLCVSRKTIESHRLKIMKKLNSHSIAGLTKYAIKEGLTDL